jgi:hypothetical protein
MEELQRLITEACQHSAESPVRQKKLTQIIRLVAPQLWKEQTDYYEDALQQTWLFFTKNLCNYDPQQASVVTWLNNHLKWRLHDLKVKQAKQQAREDSIDARNADPDQGTFEIVDPVSSTPDDGESALMAEFVTWLKTDPTGELKAAHMRGLVHINCQALIQRRLMQEETWEVLAKDFDKSVPTLSSHFQRKCIPCLRKVWSDLRNPDATAR